MPGETTWTLPSDNRGGHFTPAKKQLHASAGSNGRPQKKRGKSFVQHKDKVGDILESVDVPGRPHGPCRRMQSWRTLSIANAKKDATPLLGRMGAHRKAGQSLPSDATVEDNSASPTPKKTLHASAGSNGRPQKKRGKSFVQHKDKVGRTYYESVDVPGETTWTLPSDAILEDVTSFSPIAAIKRLEEV